MNIFTSFPIKKIIRWKRDISRSDVKWQTSSVKYCSRIRKGRFATVNEWNTKLFVILWEFRSLKTLAQLNSLEGVRQVLYTFFHLSDLFIFWRALLFKVEWAPKDSESILIIVANFGVTAYDTCAHAFLWKTEMTENFSLFTNYSISLLYDSLRGK